MKNRAALIFSMVFLLLAGPAAASDDIREIGSTPLMPNNDIYVQWMRIEGPLEMLELRSVGGDAECVTVRANFRDGSMRILMHGKIPADQPLRFPFENGETNIRSVSLRCSGPETATLVVTGDVGRFADEWASRSAWRSAWAAAHNWGSRVVNRWSYVGSHRFQSNYDEGRIVAGDSRVRSLALYPVGIDARCRGGQAHLAGGKTVPLALGRDHFLAHDEFYKLELPPDMRGGVEAVALDCRATTGGNVLIQVFGAG